jgi:acyl carrier protein
MLRADIEKQMMEIYSLITSNDVENIKETSNLHTDLGLSSIGMLYLIIAIEQKFNIVFENVSMGDFEIVKDVIDYIEKKVN